MLDEVLLALGAGDVVHVLEHALQRPEPLQQLGGGLVPDSRHARDVVARIALQTDEVRDQLGRDPVALDHSFSVVHAGIGDPPRRGHDLHAVAHELVGVAVPGDHHHGNGRLGVAGLLDDRGDHVVCLVPLHRQVAVPECLHQRLEVRPLLLEQVGTRGPLRLVVGVYLLAARRSRIPHHQRRLRPVIGEDLDQHGGEPEDRVRRHSGRGGDRFGQGEERPVGKAVAVD